MATYSIGTYNDPSINAPSGFYISVDATAEVTYDNSNVYIKLTKKGHTRATGSLNGWPCYLGVGYKYGSKEDTWEETVTCTSYEDNFSRTTNITLSRQHSAQLIQWRAYNSLCTKDGNFVCAAVTSTLCSNMCTIPAKASYTVSFNANGGSGAPGNQTKWYGETLTLSSTKPTRTGYTFQGWATSASGSVTYAAGGSYTANSGTTLYAVWKASTYTISYNANGGSGAPSSQSCTYTGSITLSSTKPTRAKYTFSKWTTAANGTGTAYAPGATFKQTSASNTTLYAQWASAYNNPSMSITALNRCTSDGTLSDDGAYAKLSVSWNTSSKTDSTGVCYYGKTLKAVVNGVTYSTDLGSTATSGTWSVVMGAGVLDTEKTYTAALTLTDNSGVSVTLNGTVPSADYRIDFSPEGGVGIGGVVAPSSNKLLVGSGSTEFQNAVTFDARAATMNGLCFIGNNPTGGSANDTREFWKAKGNCIARFSQLDQVNGQPNQWGYLLNIVGNNSDEVHQEWWTQPGGAHYKRGVNTSSTNMPSWTKIMMATDILNAVYPVGAVYISYVSTSPASLFGGSWTQITDRFLRMANDVDTGGADTHTLTVAQMPSHSHTSNGSILFDKGSWSTTHSGTVPTPAGSSVSTPFNDASKTFSSTGGGGAHNNMPAYQDLYAWRRTA